MYEFTVYGLISQLVFKKGACEVYKALYRKYRPKGFDAVIGQDQVTKILQAEIIHKRISHAYLFCGSRGTGKTTSAKIFAKAVNCLDPVNGSPCGKCDACRAIDSGLTLDVIEMDAASNNGVNDIRDVIENVSYTPAELKYRVYIIDEVHMLSTQAFNALLKTLEEPPANVIFILATTELHKLPATIISRCQRHDFNRIDTSDIVTCLRAVADSEGIVCDDEALFVMARLSQGGMRDALGYLELCASSASKLDLYTVSKLLGTTNSEELTELITAVAKRDTSLTLSVFSRISGEVNDTLVLWFDLISCYRDMLVIKATDSDRFVDLLPNQIKKVRQTASLFTVERINCHIAVLNESVYQMQRNPVQKRIIAEMTLLRMCCERLDDSYSALLSRIAELEDRMMRLGSGIPPVSPAAEKPAEADVAVKEESAPSLPDTSASEAPMYKPIRLWPDIVAKLREKLPIAGAFITQAQGFESPGDKSVKLLFNTDIALVLAKQNEDDVKDAVFCTLQGKYPLDRIYLEKTTAEFNRHVIDDLFEDALETEI